MSCIHNNIKKYRIKDTPKISWICEDCGDSGVIIGDNKKIPQNHPKQLNQGYPHIVGDKIEYSDNSLQGNGLPPRNIQNSALTGQNIGFKSISENLQSGMQDLNKGLQNMPHLIIGKQNNSNNNNNSQLGLSEKEQKIINKLKKWFLVIAVLAVVGYAGYRIIIGFF